MQAGSPETGLAARGAALAILRAVREGAPFDQALRDAVESLDDPDRRLAHEIAAGILRSRDELDDALTTRVRADWRRVDEDLKDILRIGAYQLMKLERVPAHAAVDSAVELAKRESGAKSGGFVNAILRRLSREEPTADPDDHGDLARRHSHPAWLVDRWTARFGTERAEALLVHDNTRPGVTVQAARWSEGALRDAFVRAGVEFSEPAGAPGLTLQGGRIEQLPGYVEGGFIVQDPAQALAMAYAGIDAGARVWDACAAPGGKAVGLARRCDVVASDSARNRMGRLLDTVRRAAPTVKVVTADATRPPFPDDSMDVVLIDAPCSATGTIARHPDARWQLSPERIARMAEKQAVLLAAASAVVRPGGQLVYMTCSLEREENEDQVDRFLSQHAGFEREMADLFLFPPDTGTDGAFVSCMAGTA